jgi:REP element-mobilizing transposase RayT
VVPAVGRLRRRHVYKIAQRALVTCWKRSHAFRICHISIQGSHLHLIVEADDKHALARGMQGFQISFARRINARLGRSGRVFADRYHAVELDGPTKVRNAMAYVLNNWRRHGEDRGVFATKHDVYSSGVQSDIWAGAPQLLWLKPGQELLPVCYPRTWLLGQGWKKVGPVSPWIRPGPS